MLLAEPHLLMGRGVLNLFRETTDSSPGARVLLYSMMAGDRLFNSDCGCFRKKMNGKIFTPFSLFLCTLNVFSYVK